ncbi:MAG TPA: alcohol dehydrogenase catalytic domain-containing protein [Acidimicrobiales bacterium]|nr:alcohol dehydrogenase catalytic domain-containing protein [Acidimicrobiales bacterium]
MQALVWQGGSLVETVDVATPCPPAGWALVQPAFVGICGTDLHICAGEHPRAKPSLVLGHEFVGWVVEGGGDAPPGAAVFVNPLLPCGDCSACAAGRPNTCERLGFLGIDRAGGAAELAAVPADSMTPLPAGLALERAALVEPVAVAAHAVRRGAVVPGDAVHVLGAGPVGLLVAWLARLRGAAQVSVSDPAPERAGHAHRLGFDVVAAATTEPKARVVFDCTGHASVAPTVTRCAAAGGVVVTVGAYPGVVGVDLQDLMFREITIVGSRAYTTEDISDAIGLLASGSAAPATVITDVIPLDNGAEAIRRLRRGSGLKVLLQVPRSRADKGL